ncbi:MAG TPA: hypothetical protein HA367_08435 [Candidatus Methanofastidiosum sp.]|nr:hypothetical protein [Methanofastidiosum sp.]
MKIRKKPYGNTDLPGIYVIDENGDGIGFISNEDWIKEESAVPCERNGGVCPFIEKEVKE